MKSFRKANSFAEQKWVVKKAEPKESGNALEDVIEFVRSVMYKELVDECESDDEVSFDTCNILKSTEGVPDRYFFPGYMAFLVWGPFVEEKFRLPVLLFNIGDAHKDYVLSRTEKRKKMLL